MIKAILMDMDGCLTDGSYLVHSGLMPGRWRKFHTRDWHGINKAIKQGILCAVITGDSSDCILNQKALSSELNVKNLHVFTSIEDKLTCARKFLNKHGISLDEAAYIGDDELDIPLLKEVGLPACPVDAHTEVKFIVEGLKDGLVTHNLKGGEGCVRRLIDTCLSFNNIHKSLEARSNIIV